MSYTEVAKQYDIDYEGAEFSLYNARFGNEKIIRQERKVIIKNFQKMHNNLKLKHYIILDFGCGDGRFLPVIEELADKNKDINLELIAYDISRTGLNIFAKNLQSNGYNQLKNNIWNKNNLKIFIRNDIKNGEFSYNSVHMIISMFGVLGHIETYDLRAQTIKEFKQILKDEGTVIINVSTKKSLPAEVDAYNLLRKQYKALCTNQKKRICKHFEGILQKATEDNNCYYTKTNSKITTHNFGHVYTYNELIKDMKIAGLRNIKTGVMSIKQPYILSQSRIRDYFDYILSNLLSININIYPFNQADTIAKNIYTIGYK